MINLNQTPIKLQSRNSYHFNAATIEVYASNFNNSIKFTLKRRETYIAVYDFSYYISIEISDTGMLIESEKEKSTKFIIQLLKSASGSEYASDKKAQISTQP